MDLVPSSGWNHWHFFLREGHAALKMNWKKQNPTSKLWKNTQHFWPFGSSACSAANFTDELFSIPTVCHQDPLKSGILGHNRGEKISTKKITSDVTHTGAWAGSLTWCKWENKCEQNILKHPAITRKCCHTCRQAAQKTAARFSHVEISF